MAGQAAAAGGGAAPSAGGADPAASSQALTDLTTYLTQPRSGRPALTEQPFAKVALTRTDAASAHTKLWEDFAAFVRETRMAEVGATTSSARTVKVEGVEHVLRYYMERRGTAPASGFSLFISMHGGGNAPAATNDSQWENQIALADGYDPQAAIWIAPRAPIDDWNMWFIEDIDPLFEQLIADMIVFEGVDPNKVYINGYSAGGDGVYQVGPRMADRWAGAGMSAGHPNASSPLSLRNLPFAIHVGGEDTAYDRNLKAAEWGMRLEMLAAADPGGYINQWQVHQGKPHWMDMEDAVSIPFLQMHTRDPQPAKVVWEQADVPRGQFYWLAVSDAERGKGDLVRARYDAEGIHIDEVKGVERLTVRLSDEMLDLDKDIAIEHAGKPLPAAKAQRTIATLERTLEERTDPKLIWPSEIEIDLAQ
ncbi:MAG: alpha/beta hydrolase [Polyangiales bacterium]